MTTRHPLVALDRRHVWHPFTQERTASDPIPISHARGTVLHTTDGREYLDLISSWWVITHGHGHPAIAQAIGEQAKRLEQVIFAGFTHEPAVRLAEGLIARLPEGLNRVFYSDNGSTSVEVALKMSCQYWQNRGEARKRFLAFEGGYHGDTVGAMSMGQTSGFFDAFRNMLFPVDTLPYPTTWEGDERIEQKEKASLAAVAEYLSRHGSACAAVLLEPLIQGAGGMRMCRPGYLAKLAALVKEAGVLLIFDEVMTGFGRTGALFACEKAGVIPDIICLSKGLTAGFMPLSATVCQERIYEAFLGEGFDRAFTHGHSFTANPLGCAAAVASLALFETEKTLQRVARIEEIHRQRLAALSRFPKARQRRVTGVVAALDVAAGDPGYQSKVGPWLKHFFLEQGLLLRPLGNVVYLLPPYCITEAELHRAWDGVEAALKQVA
ncbi:MAG: adenosylmethionine--8-amino-7-oxononanoate transaminase [Magnetococcales bacterium]|nr:adenosylmethionine--8-amino-7-oxononanoate transaminase [Magnetococcales bacterium]